MDVTGPGIFNDSKSKRVLGVLKTGYWDFGSL